VKPKTRKLTKKQKKFVLEYIKDSNGTRAAIEAGYSQRTAAEIAYELLHKTSHVKAAIQMREEEHLRKIGVTSEKVMAKMAHLAFADIRKIYNPELNTLLPVKDFPDEIIPAIAGIKTTEIFDGTGEDRHLVGYTKEVRLWNPDTSLTNMAKNTGAIGNGKHRDEDEEEDIGKVMTTLELSARLVYLVKLAVERKKEIEGKNGKV
jgi:phage terminase small subunit